MKTQKSEEELDQYFQSYMEKYSINAKEFCKKFVKDNNHLKFQQVFIQLRGELVIKLDNFTEDHIGNPELIEVLAVYVEETLAIQNSKYTALYKELVDLDINRVIYPYLHDFYRRISFDRIYKKERLNIKINGKDLWVENKPSINKLVPKLKRHIITHKIIEKYIPLMAKYIVLKRAINELTEEIKNIPADENVGLGLIDLIADYRSESRTQKGVKLTIKDFVVLMYKLEQSNLISSLDIPSQRLIVLNGIIPNIENLKIDSTIKSHYNNVSVKEYLKQNNNYNRRLSIANKLREIADEFDNRAK